MLETTTHPELTPVAVAAANYPSLEGRNVIITGGGSGIGMYLVEAFSRQGARVGFIDIDEANAQRVVDLIAPEVAFAPRFEIADLRDIDALQASIEALRAQLGPVHTLVNNAGNDDRMPAEEVTPQAWDDRMAVNLRHYFFAAQALLPDLAAQQGAIINMGSNSWMQGAPGMIAYTTAKSAIQGLTRSLAREVGTRHIRVNSIAPGWILTDRQVSRAKAQDPDRLTTFLDRQCLREHLLPPDVARMTLFLSADDSRLITGQTFVVDGGVV